MGSEVRSEFLKLSVVTGSALAKAGGKFSAAIVSPFRKKFSAVLDRMIPVDPRAAAGLQEKRLPGRPKLYLHLIRRQCVCEEQREQQQGLLSQF